MVLYKEKINVEEINERDPFQFWKLKSRRAALA